MMPLAQYIPMSCLAGVLVVVAYNMSGWRTFAALLKTPKSDIVILLVTFLLTVVFDLTVAIQVGLLIACLLLMRRVAEITDVRLITDKINLNDDTDVLLDKRSILLFPMVWKCTKSMVLISLDLATVSRNLCLLWAISRKFALFVCVKCRSLTLRDFIILYSYKDSSCTPIRTPLVLL